MANVKENIQKVYDECTALYEKGGVTAVCDHVIAQQQAHNPMYEDVKYKQCTPCEAGQPNLYDVCLVCGSDTSTPKRKPIMYGDTIVNVQQLNMIMSTLDDHDQLTLVTCDEHGDEVDHFPMAIDVIDNIRLTDDTIVREVQFIQRPNCAPDTRDKQPLVDAVIEEITNDIVFGGDSTVLDELLLRIPWEILKGSLPEEQWKPFDDVTRAYYDNL